jgi:hypothetical protein
VANKARQGVAVSAAKASLSRESALDWLRAHFAPESDLDDVSLSWGPNDFKWPWEAMAAASDMTEALMKLRLPLRSLLGASRLRLARAGVQSKDVGDALDAFERAACAVALAWAGSGYFRNERRLKRGQSRVAADARHQNYGIRYWITAHTGRPPTRPEVVIAEIVLGFRKPCRDELEFAERRDRVGRLMPARRKEVTSATVAKDLEAVMVDPSWPGWPAVRYSGDDGDT